MTEVNNGISRHARAGSDVKLRHHIFEQKLPDKCGHSLTMRNSAKETKQEKSRQNSLMLAISRSKSQLTIIIIVIIINKFT